MEVYGILSLVPTSMSPPLLHDSEGRKEKRSCRETCWTMRLSPDETVTPQTRIRSTSFQEKKPHNYQVFLQKTIISVPASVTTRNRQGLRNWNSSVSRRDCQALCWSSGCKVSEDMLQPLRSSPAIGGEHDANKEHRTDSGECSER